MLHQTDDTLPTVALPYPGGFVYRDPTTGELLTTWAVKEEETMLGQYGSNGYPASGADVYAPPSTPDVATAEVLRELSVAVQSGDEAPLFSADVPAAAPVTWFGLSPVLVVVLAGAALLLFGGRR